MDTQTTEQAVRREAIRRRVQGQPRWKICQDLKRSPRWFNKWWHEYRANPQTDLADHSRAPRTSPRQLPPEVVRVVVNTRHWLEAAQTPQTRYGLIGHRAIQGRLMELAVEPLPSLPSIQRILLQHEMTYALGAGQARAYYPWPVAWGVNAIHATDTPALAAGASVIMRQVRGGEGIKNFHTLDHYSWAVCLSPQADQTSATTRTHLLKTGLF